MLISEIYSRNWSPLIVRSKSPERFLQQFPVVAPQTKIGIEIEAENYSGFPTDLSTLAHITNTWMQKAEPSLRNNGIEFITGAISGPQIGEALSLLSTMNTLGNLVYTELAGLHVHLNVRDFDVEQLTNLVMLYLVFEDSLYRISGDRRNSIYCVPARECISGLHHLIHSQSLLESIRAANKYMGFNYATVKTYGSVEFRHSKGCPDVSYILHWINTLLRLHTAAKIWDTKSLQSVIFKLNTNSEYVQFAKDIFKTEFDWIETAVLDQEMSEGVSILKEWSIASHLPSTKILDEPLVQRRPPKPKSAPLPILKIEGGVLIIDDVVQWNNQNDPIRFDLEVDRVVPRVIPRR